MRTINKSPELTELIDSVAAWHDQVPETVERLAAVAMDAISTDPRTVADRVEELAMELLTSTDRFAGAGIVSVHPAVTTRSRSLLWWVTHQENGQRNPSPLDADLTELGTYQDGLEDIEWYRVPATTGLRHMTGPFVDYMCTDQFAFTFTMPLMIEREFYGVAGIDMSVRSLEVDVESQMQRLSEDAILLANDDLIAISLDPRFATGSRLKPAQLEGYSINQVPGTALSVAVPR